jgi:hypothetical protein
MLNDAERRRLAEIESSLRTNDPSFVRRFEAQRRLRGRHVVAVLVFLTPLIVILASLVRDTAAAVGLVTCAATFGLWLLRRAE